MKTINEDSSQETAPAPGNASPGMIRRLVKVSLIIQLVIMILIYVFTKNLFYSIIFLLGGILSIAGFLFMIKMTDRVLASGKKKASRLFFLAGLLKIGIIAAFFFMVSRISETAVIFHIMGLSIIVLSIVVEGFYQLYRSQSNGRT